MKRAIIVGGFLDNRTPDCDGAGLWIGQIKDNGKWVDATDMFETRQMALDALEIK